MLSLAGVIAIVVDSNGDSASAQIDMFCSGGGEVVGNTQDNIKGSILHDDMNITGDSSFGSEEELSKGILLVNGKPGGRHVHTTEPGNEGMRTKKDFLWC